MNMHCRDLPLPGAYLIELKKHVDTRGAFSRLFCSETLNMLPSFPQINLSENTTRGTLRGLHYQAHPYLEGKLIYCLRGSVHDVIVDLRRDSPTYKQHYALTLTAHSPHALYVPEGCAHGFMTLEEDSHLLYLMSTSYQSGYERGYRYDDPAFKISWPMPPTLMSERDQNYPPFKETNDLT